MGSIPATIKGSQLAPLLQEFATQRVSAVRQRMEMSKEGPQIDDITVVKAKRDEE